MAGQIIKRGVVTLTSHSAARSSPNN